MDSCKSYLNKHFNATIQENWPFTVKNEQSSLVEIKTVPVRGVRNFSAKFIRSRARNLSSIQVRFSWKRMVLKKKLNVNRFARLQGKEKTKILQGQERLHHRMRGRMTFLELQIRLVMNTLI